MNVHAIFVEKKKRGFVQELVELHLNYGHFSGENHCFNMKFWGAPFQTNLSVKVGRVPLVAEKWVLLLFHLWYQWKKDSDLHLRIQLT